MTKGIDVSVHQGEIDWKKVKADSVDFAIIRAGYGRELSQKDTQFEKNYAGCKSNSIPVGAYWYSYALSTEDAKKEAETCLKAIDNKVFEYPIYFDIENKTQLALSEELLQKITIAFCDELEASGYWVGIYSFKSFLESNFTPEILKRYAVWVAHTGVTQTSYKYQHGIWQYSHTGKIDGINTNVDLNYGYIDYPKLMKSAGLNGYSKNDNEQLISYKVVKNDTLWDIAEKYLGNGTRYKEIKILNNLKSDTIFPEQILKLPKK